MGILPDQMTLAEPHPDYREMHVFQEGREMIRDFNMSFYPAGALFKAVFDAYPCVYFEVRNGVMQYRLQRETRVKDALEALGVPEGAIVKIYADHSAW